MCPHIQLQNFISDKEPLIEEESLIFVDYDMPELIEDEEYRDMPELIEDEEFYRDMPELIEDEEFYRDMPELIEDKEFYRDIPELDVEANISDILLKMNNQ